MVSIYRYIKKTHYHRRPSLNICKTMQRLFVSGFRINLEWIAFVWLSTMGICLFWYSHLSLFEIGKWGRGQRGYRRTLSHVLKVIWNKKVISTWPWAGRSTNINKPLLCVYLLCQVVLCSQLGIQPSLQRNSKQQYIFLESWSFENL